MLTLAYLTFVALIIFIPIPNKQFWYGAIAVGYPWLVEAILFHAHPSGSIALGGIAEQWTSDELKKLRCWGWQLVDHVEFEDMDVDHVIVGPGGVFAIETKWKSGWKVEAGVLQTPFSDPVGQANFGARKIRLLLRSRGIDVEVLPALCLWGPGLNALDGNGRLARSVQLLKGREAKSRRSQIVARGHRLGGDEVEAIGRELRGYVDRHERYVRQGKRS